MAASLARMTVCLLVPYRFASAETLVTGIFAYVLLPQ
jgi:hypothetical protein